MGPNNSDPPTLVCFAARKSKGLYVRQPLKILGEKKDTPDKKTRKLP